MTEDEILRTSILNCERSDLYLDRFPLSPEQSSDFIDKKTKRLEGFPLQYIIGETEFFGLRFKVDERAFIPRPETEILVEKTIERVKGQGLSDKVMVLDIGTGSGAIAIALAKSLPRAQITASDISGGALDLARENAKINEVDNKIDFVRSDLFDNISFKEYDLIVSNPPYIVSGDMDSLPRDVKHEPAIALDGGNDGLDFYRGIINRGKEFLKKGGFILFEIGFGQSKKIKHIFAATGWFDIVDAVKDYNDIERVIVARLIKETR